MSDRIRLRPAYSDDELAKIYATPHDHTKWEDHLVRVATTAQFARTCAGKASRAADLSCGDGAVLDAIRATEKVYGDYAPGYPLTGPIEQTIDRISPVDVFVCCETLEHLDDPDLVLRKIRAKARGLVLSTPVGAFDDTNPEHYHAWSREAVEAMMVAAGFQLRVYMELDFRSCGGVYAFGVWWVA